MNIKQIEVKAAKTQQAVLDGQCDVVNSFDTVADAKMRARYYLTDDYMRASETNEPLTYAQVVVDGVCVADYFRN